LSLRCVVLRMCVKQSISYAPLLCTCNAAKFHQLMGNSCPATRGNAAQSCHTGRLFGSFWIFYLIQII